MKSQGLIFAAARKSLEKKGAKERDLPSHPDPNFLEPKEFSYGAVPQPFDWVTKKNAQAKGNGNNSNEDCNYKTAI